MNQLMHHLFSTTIGAGALLCCAALAPSAHASTVTLDFESLADHLLGHNQTLAADGLLLTGFSNEAGARTGDFVGGIFNGADGRLCASLACPSNDASQYYAATNDGVLFIDPAKAGTTFAVKSFDASFVGAYADGAYPATAGYLEIQGYFADGSYNYIDVPLFGPEADTGEFNFYHYQLTGGFGSQQFIGLGLFGYVCDSGSGSCSAFNSNRGQFALDNLVLDVVSPASAVPEPASYASLLLGLAGIAAALRRRRTGEHGAA